MLRLAALLAAASSLAAFAAAQMPPPPPLQPWLLQGAVEAARAFAANATLVTPTGLTRVDYLKTAESIVTFWAQHQAANGSIIDPETGHEMQYSTPHFAWAATAVYAVLNRSDLLEPASLALDFSIASMHNGSAFCAQATCDFYAVPVMRSYLALVGVVEPARAAMWTAQLKSLEPNKTYEFTGQNWELCAAAGEFIRMQQLGFSNGSADWSLWEARIGRLATIDGPGFFNGNGQFCDNWGQPKTSPHAYDAFADAYTTMLLDLGYGAAGAPAGTYHYGAYLGALMARAAETHALFQGPWGEIPVGGRSGQHQWNEAVMAYQYEVAALTASKAGDAGAACRFRRAARLSLASVRRWLRPDGALQIVKNRFMDPAQRVGFEEYSFFSQYNLLPAAWLVNAYLAASDDDAVPECAAAADVGGAAFALPYATFRKVFAAAQGTYVEIMTGADPEYDATGLYRVHFRGCGATWGSPAPGCTAGTVDSLLGPSAAPPLNVANPLGAPVSIGGAWWTLPGDAPGAPVRTLANNTLQSTLAAVFTPGLTNSPAQVDFSVAYVLWDSGVLVTEAYTVSPGSVTVTTSAAAPGARALFALLSDAALGEGACAGCTLMEPADASLLAPLRARDWDAFRARRPVPAGAASEAGADALPFARFGVQFPAFVFDGTNNFTVAVDATSAVIAGPPGAGLGSVAYTVQPPGPNRPLKWHYDPSVQVLGRNGVVVPVYAEVDSVGSPTPTLTYTISIAAPA